MKNHKTFMETLMKNIADFPQRIVLRSAAASRGISYSKLDEYSGKVYAYLKQNNIGKEDMVLICMPRGTRAIVSIIGVWKAGAAFTIVEDTYAVERIEFIRKDCVCKIVINADLFEEMMQTEPLYGFEKTEPHDAAFAVYTSGTTGNPKGVLHEYGKLEQAILSAKYCTAETPEGSTFAMLSPLNFVASLLIIIRALTFGNCIYVLPYDVVKNPTKLAQFFLNEKVAETFMPPSFIKIYKDVSPYLCNVYVGGEPCNGLFIEGPRMINKYGSSEVGMTLTSFVIDRPYDKTPVGKCGAGLEIMILDENGNRLPDGDVGEVCFFNEFTRGYINLPEKTKEVFTDGIYHMGDLGFINENGDLMISGRKDDMIKINGNRIEPAEIEIAIREKLDVKNVVVKGFNENNRSFVCAYLISGELDEKDLLKNGNLIFSSEEMTQRLQKRLPYYMIPTCYVVMDKFPLNANGKIDKKSMKAPYNNAFVDEYKAPSNEIEEKLCSSFERVLHIDKIGINDDFYILGGDSLTSIELLADCGIDGLNASDIFAGRTPRKIAALWFEKHSGDEDIPLAELNEKMLCLPQPLMDYQTYMIDYQLYTPFSTMHNLNIMFKVNFDEIPRETIVRALNKAIANHPALLTRFQYGSTGNLEQVYEPAYTPDLQIEKMNSSDFCLLKDGLVKPFKLINSQMYRCRIFDVEGQGYVFFDVHHTLFDGTSFQVLLGDVLKSIHDTELEPDYYYAMLHQQENMLNSERSCEAKEYYERMYGTDDFAMKPIPDHISRKNTIGHYSVDMNRYDTALDIIESKYGLNRNAFFNAIVLLSLAINNRCVNVQCTWAYNGRDDLAKSNMVGLLLKDIPIMLRLCKNDKIKEIYKSVQEQVANGLAYSFYPYTVKEARVVEDDRICFLYQRNIRDAVGANFETVDIKQNSAASENAVDVQVIDDSNGLSLMIDYAASLYEESGIVNFASVFIAVFEFLIQHDGDSTVAELVKNVEKQIYTKELFNEWLK